MSAQQSLFRAIPKVDELLVHPLVAPAAASSHSAATQAIREILDALREDIQNGRTAAPPPLDVLAEQVVARLCENATPSLRRLINATGVILHTNLGRAPLAPYALKAVEQAAYGYSTLEYDLQSGGRGSRHSHVAALIARLSGAEDALVVNNNAAAVLLMLSAICAGKEVIVSRGELVEIGGAFRIPEVMEQSGCVLREVGATNRTRVSDYARAINPERTGALFKAHTSNFKIIGFHEEVSCPELAALGAEHSIPVLYDLGSGSLFPLEPYGIQGEPSVPQCVAHGADIVSFSGDKLLGGPQAGIILGKKKYIEQMKRHPLARALRIDKLTLAALEATLRLCLDAETAWREVPTLRMLAANPQELREKAARLFGMLGPLGNQAYLMETDSQVGGGSLPGQTLASTALAISPESISLIELEQRLRNQDIPVVARIARDRLLLDVRTVDEADFEYIARLLTGILGV